MKSSKIALVHDWLINIGGAERVLISFHNIFPEAPIYTLFYNKNFVSKYLPKARIIPSFLQKIPKIQKLYPWFKILMPLAIESLNLKNFDLVISSSHEFAHGVLLKQNTKHICYYYSPSRLLWDRTNEYAEEFKKRGKGMFKILLIKLGQHFLRLWDWSVSQRIDLLIADSKHVARRIKKFYNKKAIVIYPPVNINQDNIVFDESIKITGDYFLIVAQLYPHKNIDIAIEAFKKLTNFNLVIIGQGPEKKFLKSKISNFKNIKLLGFVPDERLPFYYKNSLAYILPNEEDFGITPIEAMLFGKPVLALKKGGALETVIEGVNGEFFEEATPESLVEGIRKIYSKVKSGYFSPVLIKKTAQRFSEERFKQEIMNLVSSL